MGRELLDMPTISRTQKQLVKRRRRAWSATPGWSLDEQALRLIESEGVPGQRQVVTVLSDMTLTAVNLLP